MKKTDKNNSFFTKTQYKVLLLCLGITLLILYGLAWFYSVTEPEQIEPHGFNLQLSKLIIMAYDFCLFILSTIALFVFLPLGAVIFFISLKKPNLRKCALIFLAIGLGGLIIRLYLLPLII